MRKEGEMGRKAGQEGGELRPAGKSTGPVGPWDLNICIIFLWRGVSKNCLVLHVPWGRFSKRRNGVGTCLPPRPHTVFKGPIVGASPQCFWGSERERGAEGP